MPNSSPVVITVGEATVPLAFLKLKSKESVSALACSKIEFQSAVVDVATCRSAAGPDVPIPILGLIIPPPPEPSAWP